MLAEGMIKRVYVCLKLWQIILVEYCAKKDIKYIYSTLFKWVVYKVLMICGNFSTEISVLKTNWEECGWHVSLKRAFIIATNGFVKFCLQFLFGAFNELIVEVHNKKYLNK